ncbi:MAG: GTPase domain-containing protein [Polyangiaceae bacterium]|nr:GTPase domain-containing protein [Polyangiaceae bacterium]
MAVVDRILLVYYGPFLAGRHTSLGHATGHYPYYADTFRGTLGIQGDEFDLFLQITRFRSFLGPFPYAELISDERYGAEREHLRGELESLRRTSGVLFVADPGRPEANAAALTQLRADLREAGKTPDDIPVVFQLNKQDLIAAGLVPPFDRSAFDWGADHDFVETTASRGIGSRDALDRAVVLAARARRAGRGGA